MGMNFNLFNSESIKSLVNSFVRSEKGEDAKSTSKAKATSKSGAASAAKAMDAFQLASEPMDTSSLDQMQESINFSAETKAACDWASELPLEEALEEINPDIGNKLMFMSLFSGFGAKKKMT